MRSIAKFLGQAVLIAASAVTTLSAWAAVPAKPTGTSPGTAASPGPIQASASVTLSWGAVSGATKYGLGVVDVATGALVVNTDLSGKTTYTAGLQSGKSYRWNVNACNASACSTYTSLLYFQTPAPAKALSSVAVSCPTTVNEGTTGSCSATAKFSDNSTTSVTSSASWNVSPAYATISSAGVLTGAAVVANQAVTVTASYTYSGVTKSNTAPVTIVDVPIHFNLNVSTNGTGSGKVTSNIGGINCGAGAVACNATYQSGANVVLTAAPDATTSTFTGWAGACSGTSGSVCTLAMVQIGRAHV